jgi:hypothetical protein
VTSKHLGVGPAHLPFGAEPLRALRRVPTVAALLYAFLSVIFVLTWDAALLEEDILFADAYWAVALLIHPVAGFLIPRLWALLLPWTALAVSLPFSEPVGEEFAEPGLDSITTAGVMFFGGVYGTIVLAFGIACRLTFDALREPL